MTTIEARLVDAGIGLPKVWKSCEEDDPDHWGLLGMHLEPTDLVDLTDAQTAFGVALRLDEWERARGVVPSREDPSWTALTAMFCEGPPADYLQMRDNHGVRHLRRMAKRVEIIGRTAIEEATR